jgi:flavin reductase (DIM6/NTAB) family NADH-FMN oxidoreductase RutF
VTRWLSLIRDGKGLRHVPVVVTDVYGFAPRVVLHGLPGGPVDVSGDHCPVSLRPLLVGMRLGSKDALPPDPARQLSLEICPADPASAPLARLALRPAGIVPLKHDALHLFEPDCTANRCVPLPTLWLRYLLAWQHDRTAAKRGDALRMSPRDLRALNAYYIVPRPVFLVGVAHEGQENLFPMDLVGALSSGEYLLALRSTSPSVALMEASRHIAMSSAPAAQLQAVYALGKQHHLSALDLSTLTVPVARSPLFGLPVLEQDGLMRELFVERVERIGSHALFVTRIEREAGHAGRQLAHMSGMYAEWLRRERQACEVLAPL